MNKHPPLSHRTRFLGPAILLTLGAAFTMNGCGADTAGFGCYSDDECPDDLACEVNQQGAVCSEGFCGCDYQQGICSQFCESDDDCPYDLVCNKESTCGGDPDLCGRP